MLQMEQFCQGESGIAEKKVRKSLALNITMNKVLIVSYAKWFNLVSIIPAK